MLAAAEAGAEDVTPEGDSWQVTTAPTDLARCATRSRRPGLRVIVGRADAGARKTTVELDADGARRLLRLIDALEDQDDVQDVYANFDIPDAVLEAVAG